jgi:hypothetical protein
MTTDSELQLMPCPFCGGEAQLFKPGPFKWTVLHKCDAVRCEISPGKKAKVIALWNQR